MGGVFRQIPSKIITAEEMGLSKEILAALPPAQGAGAGHRARPARASRRRSCALIDYINRNRTDHIITIEDPMEFVHENKKCLINQRQVGEHTDSFKDALRAALREDPDIVLVGEMRDLETVAIAIETAETGPPGVRDPAHLVGAVDGGPHHRPVPGRPAGADPRHAGGEPQGRDQPDAVQEDRRRPRAGAGGADRHAVGREPDPRGQDLPDPVHHADGQEVRHVPDERRASPTW